MIWTISQTSKIEWLVLLNTTSFKWISGSDNFFAVCSNNTTHYLKVQCYPMMHCHVCIIWDRSLRIIHQQKKSNHDPSKYQEHLSACHLKKPAKTKEKQQTTYQDQYSPQPHNKRTWNEMKAKRSTEWTKNSYFSLYLNSQLRWHH